MRSTRLFSFLLAVTFAALVTSPARADESAAEDKPDDGSRLRPFAWGAAAGATLALTFGIVEMFVASNRAGDFNRRTNASGAFDCVVGAPLSAACYDLARAGDRADAWKVTGFVAAGVLAATSATLFILAHHRESESTGAPILACAPALTTPGMSCRMTF